MSDSSIVILVPLTVSLGLAVAVVSGAWDTVARLVPGPVRGVAGRQRRWALWAAFLLGALLMVFSLAGILHSG
jgi:hypothetical protein